MDLNYFYLKVSHVTDEDWNSEGLAVAKVNGANLSYNSTYDYYYLDFSSSDYAAGDTITLSFAYDDLDSVTLTASVPVDIATDSVTFSPSIPGTGVSNAATSYTVTPTVTADNERFYVKLRKYASNSSSDYDSSYGWLYFQSVTVDAEDLLLKDGTTNTEYFVFDVYGCRYATDSSVYDHVSMYIPGRNPDTYSNLTNPPASGVSLGAKTDLEISKLR